MKTMNLFAQIQDYQDNIQSRVRRIRRVLPMCEHAHEVLSPDELGKLEIIRGKITKEVSRLENLYRYVGEDLRMTSDALVAEITERVNEPLYPPMAEATNPNRALMDVDEDEEEDPQFNSLVKNKDERKKALLKKVLLGWIETGWIS